MNTLYLGDNLPILQSLESESVDLIYIDPPFNSNRNYSGMIKEKTNQSSSNATILAQFEDTWRGGMKTYIHEFMFPIVKELHRILKPTGSFYLHCDPTAQAYLQVEILDKIFGISNFRNEIVWCYSGPSAVKNQFPRKHDVIFFYSKSSENNFKPIFVEHKSGIHNKGTLHGKIKTDEKTDQALRERENKGKLLEDYWTDIGAGAHISPKERTGYPTQKPEKLLERIILASSNVGDTVLDCFMGSGTTLVVADKLERNFIGIDQSPVALAVTKSRLALNQDLFNNSHDSLQIITKKWDWDKLRKMDDFEFEKLMVTKLGGKMLKQGKSSDGGIDGIVNSKTVIQIKRSEGVSVNVLKNLKSTIEEWRWEDKNMTNAKQSCVIKIQKGDVDLANYDGIIVAFSFAKTIYASSVDYKIKSGFNFLILTVEDILPVAIPPKVEIIAKDETKTLGFWSFTAICQTASKIENYSWTIRGIKTHEIIDCENLSKEKTFSKALKKGSYKISCEVVDENGLSGKEEIEVLVG
jgi:DNA modification methylase